MITRKFIVALSLSILLVSPLASFARGRSGGYVRGYTRSNGTHVGGYHRGGSSSVKSPGYTFKSPSYSNRRYKSRSYSGSSAYAPPIYRAPTSNGSSSYGDETSAQPRILRKGMHGNDVKQWQLFLAGQGFWPGPPDGSFGPRTHQQTILFQRKHDLFQDGIVGSMTRRVAQLLGLNNITVSP